MDAIVGTVEYLSPEQALGQRARRPQRPLLVRGHAVRDADGRRAVPPRLGHRDGARAREGAGAATPLRPTRRAGLARRVRRAAPREDPGARGTRRPRRRSRTFARGGRRAYRGNARRRALAIAAVLAVAVLAAVVVGRQLTKPSGAVRLAPHANAKRRRRARRERSRPLGTDRPAELPGASVCYRRPGGGTGRRRGPRRGPRPGADRARGSPSSIPTRAPSGGRSASRAPPGRAIWDVPDRWSFGSLEAVDADGPDGDELVFSFVNPESFPSVVVLVDPETGVSQPLLFGSGHQVFLGSVDLDGDGRKELVFASAANRLGQYAAVTALRPAAAAASGRSRGIPGPARRGHSRPPGLRGSPPAGRLVRARTAIADRRRQEDGGRREASRPPLQRPVVGAVRARLRRLPRRRAGRRSGRPPGSRGGLRPG